VAFEMQCRFRAHSIRMMVTEGILKGNGKGPAKGVIWLVLLWDAPRDADAIKSVLEAVFSGLDYVSRHLTTQADGVCQIMLR
jgi:hypothetical protein